MSQTILLKRSAVPGKKPSLSDLATGEIAVNTFDGKMYIKQDDGTPSVTEIGGDQFPVQTGLDGMFLKTNGSNVYWSDTGGTSTRVPQTAHGLTLGDIVRFDGTQYVRAVATTENTADVIGIVTDVIGVNDFELTTSGIVDFATGMTFVPGTPYFLSPTIAGVLTTTEPSGIGQVSKPLFIALTTTSGLFYNWRGIEITPEVEIDSMLPAQTGNAGSVLMTDGVSSGWKSIAEATASVTVTGTHSFTVGQIVRATSTGYVLARANSAANAQVFGIISAVSAAGSASPYYTITTFGRVPLMTGLTAGTLYYLSDVTAGALTSTEPTTTSSISKPLFIATSATEGVFYNQRGLYVAVANASPSQLLPSQSPAQNGQVLTTDGANPSWGTAVRSFNGRVGNVTLTGTDITNVLGSTTYLPIAGGTMTGSITSMANAIAAGQSAGVTRGYLYNDASGFGLANNSGGWAARVPFGTSDLAVTGSVTSGAVFASDIRQIQGQVVYPGAITASGNYQASWYLGSHSSYGLYSNTGLYTAGNVWAAGDIIAYYSDERLKNNLGNIPNALDKVCSLNGFTYTNNALAKGFGYKDPRVQVGVSAQQVQAVLPEAVTLAAFDLVQDTPDGNYADHRSKSGENYLTVNYEKLVPLLIEAIKELRAEVQTLKGQ